MQVVTSCFGRFHIFDQAVQLQRHGLLHRLISAQPLLPRGRWDVAPDKIDVFLANFGIGYLHRKVAGALPATIDSRILRFAHDAFSARLAERIPDGTDVLIGLSSFCREAILEGKRRGIRTIVDHASLHEASERDSLLRESERFGFRHSGNSIHSWLIAKEDAEFRAADHIFVLSSIAKRTLVDHGVDPVKIFVNRCGVSLDEFFPCGKADRVFRVIHCSNVSPRKGVHYLLQAFQELRLPDSELWIIGPTGALRADRRFGATVASLCGPNVVFKGAVPQLRLRTFFSQGSVFVLPSLADGFGWVVTQAMACGLPVIVSDMTGAADLVHEGRDGFVVPVRDVEALKEKLLFFYEHPESCVEMGRCAREWVTAHETWDEYGDRLAAFLTGLERF